MLIENQLSSRKHYILDKYQSKDEITYTKSNIHINDEYSIGSNNWAISGR